MLNYLLLPSDKSDFENAYLGRMNRIATWFFTAHLPVLVLIAWLNGTQPGLALTLTTGALAGPLFAKFVFESQRSISIVMGITAMLMGGLLVHFGQGPVQIEMHFYFFVLLALLAVFANPMVIVAAAATVAVHHALLWLLIPSSVFNYDAPLWVVAVHSAFVVLESVAACFIARSFYDNVISLERKVNQRTAELRQRGEEMRRLMDSVQQGFFSVNRDGLISDERSKAANEFLDIQSISNMQAGVRFSEVLRTYDAGAADWFELGLEDVFSGVMPLEVTIDQLPKRCVVHSRALRIEYSPVVEGDRVSGLAVVVSDVSAEEERLRLAQEYRELLCIFEHVLKDSSRVKGFVAETQSIMDRLQSDELDSTTFARLIHTLKGNCAVFGLERIAKACHDIEGSTAEGISAHECPAWQQLVSGWEIASSNFRRFMRNDEDSVAIQREEYTALLQDLTSNTAHSRLLQRVRGWQFERMSKQMQHLLEYAHSTAAKLNKQVSVSIEDCGLRIDMEKWSEFWSGLSHVIRNSLSHGIEVRDERQKLGKPDVGTLTIRSYVNGDNFYLSLMDDGRGLNWDRIREAATRQGLPTENERDLVDAIFCDGVSTATEVTQISGRGVGLAAVKQFTDKMQGTISVLTKENEGTEFRFCFPLTSLSGPLESSSMLASTVRDVPSFQSPLSLGPANVDPCIQVSSVVEPS